MYVEVEHEAYPAPARLIIARVNGRHGWDGRPSDRNVIRFRIRRPRALIELITMVESLPAPVNPKVDA